IFGVMFNDDTGASLPEALLQSRDPLATARDTKIPARQNSLQIINNDDSGQGLQRFQLIL
ncbi:MAG TPA: hypothetical protein VE715_05945, partial [Blastocatellia bacterium]|nr:hypothetical protein [Blastocatellia bacterium]